MLCFFRLEDSVDTTTFISALYGIENTAIAEGWPSVMYAGKTVTLLFTADDMNYYDYMMVMTEDYGMTEFSLVG